MARVKLYYKRKATILDRPTTPTSFGVEHYAEVEGEEWPMPVLARKQFPPGTTGTASYRSTPQYGLWFFEPDQ